MAVVIGMDPGQQTGVALYANGLLHALVTLAPWNITAFIEHHREASGINRVIYEDSRLQSHIFSAHKPGNKRELSVPEQLKIARNVGQIDAWCHAIHHVCAERGITCHGISPANKGAKLDAKQFESVTGWTAASNQHGRDAAMVAWKYRRAV